MPGLAPQLQSINMKCIPAAKPIAAEWTIKIKAANKKIISDKICFMKTENFLLFAIGGGKL